MGSLIHAKSPASSAQSKTPTWAVTSDLRFTAIFRDAQDALRRKPAVSEGRLELFSLDGLSSALMDAHSDTSRIQIWSCHVFVPLQVLVYHAALPSMGTSNPP